MNRVLLLPILFLLSSAFAYLPTPEGLLRNSKNVDLSKKTIVAEFLIKKIYSENQIEEKHNTQDDNKLLYQKEYKIKVLFGNFEDYRTRFAQLGYVQHQGAFYASKLTSSINFSLDKLKINQEDLGKTFFYSMLSALVNNKSDQFIQSLKRYGSTIESNVELVNEDKSALLKRYLYFLRSHPTKASRKEATNNPLKPGSYEERQEVRLTLMSNYYRKSSHVNVDKNRNNFIYVLKDKIFQAQFDYDSHFIQNFQFNLDIGTVSAYFGRPLLYNGTFEFPERVVFVSPEGQQYQISLKRVQIFVDNKNAWNKRLSKYYEQVRDNLKQKDISPSPVYKPSFVL